MDGLPCLLFPDEETKQSPSVVCSLPLSWVMMHFCLGRIFFFLSGTCKNQEAMRTCIKGDGESPQPL